MLIGSGGRIGQECAHSALLNHPLGFVGRGKVLTQALWPGMEAQVRKNNGQLVAPSTQAIDADGTYFDRSGLIRQATLNRLRFGRDGGTFETDATNIVLQNRAYNITWDQFNGMSITANDAIAPDGTLTADKLADTSSTFSSIVRDLWALSPAGAKVTMSAYILKDGVTSRFPSMQFNLTGGTQVLSEGRLNTSTGETFTATADFVVSEDAGAFRRFWVVDTDNDTGNDTARQALYPAWAATIGGVNDVTLIADITSWGSQVELGAFPSTLIPTTTLFVTRDKDNIQHDNTGQVLAKQDTGTLFMTIVPEWNAVDIPSGGIMLFDNRDGSTDGLRLRHIGGVWDFSVRSSSATTGIVPGTGSAVRGLKVRLAVNWATANFRIFENGKQTGQDLTGAAPTKLNTNNFIGQDRGSSTHACSNISYMIITEPVLSERQIENTDAVVGKAA